MKKQCATLLTCILTLTCACQAAPPAKDSAPVPYIDADAYEVYSAVLHSQWTALSYPARPVIDAETSSPAMCLRIDASAAALLAPVLDTYKSLSQTTWQLQPLFKLDRLYDLAPYPKIRGLFSPGVMEGWRRLTDLYPDADHTLITLSPVAFNADKTIAIFYMRNSCGSQCGIGGFRVLQKANGKWLRMNRGVGSCDTIS